REGVAISHLYANSHYVSTTENEGGETWGGHSYSRVLKYLRGADSMLPAEQAAVRLRNAYRGNPVAPLRDLLGPVDSDAAYEVQLINTRYWETQGRRIVGRKIGLTAAAVQKQLGVDRPDFG